MGTWNVSITGNDTAQDLRSEYAAAFFCYDVEEALQKIDDYVRAQKIDESDEEAWCDYYYSLADFMWRKGILTDAVREQAIAMITSGFGLELWADAGEKVLAARKKKLEEFRIKLLSPQPPKKKIKPNAHTERIFEPGDIVAVKLQTAGKPYTKNEDLPMTDEEFHALDGKYVLMQHIDCCSDWTSAIAPEVKDYWAHFRLFDGIYDNIPENVDVSLLKKAHIFINKTIPDVFWCESSMFYFKKRNYKVIANRKDLLSTVIPYRDNINSYINNSIFWGVNHACSNPDSVLAAAMGKKVRYGEFSGNDERLTSIQKRANRCGRLNYQLSPEENERQFLAEEAQIAARTQNALAEGGKLLSISFGKEIGIAVVKGARVVGIYVEGRYQRNGFGTKLLEYALMYIGNGAYIDVPKTHTILLRVCNKLALKEVPSDTEGCIRMMP